MTERSPTSQFRKSIKLTLALPFALLLALPGCVDQPTALSAGTTSVPAAIEPVTGLDKSSLVTMSGMQDGVEYLIVVFYLSGKVSPSQLAAAPGRVCASRNQSVADFEDESLEHPSQMPGARKLVIRCH